MNRAGRRLARGDDTRDALLAAARELLAAHQPSTLDGRTIAARAERNYATIYRQHRTKDALLFAVLEQVAADLRPNDLFTDAARPLYLAASDRNWPYHDRAVELLLGAGGRHVDGDPASVHAAIALYAGVMLLRPIGDDSGIVLPLEQAQRLADRLLR